MTIRASVCMRSLAIYSIPYILQQKAAWSILCESLLRWVGCMHASIEHCTVAGQLVGLCQQLAGRCRGIVN